MYPIDFLTFHQSLGKRAHVDVRVFGCFGGVGGEGGVFVGFGGGGVCPLYQRLIKCQKGRFRSVVNGLGADFSRATIQFLPPLPECCFFMFFDVFTDFTRFPFQIP